MARYLHTFTPGNEISRPGLGPAVATPPAASSPPAGLSPPPIPAGKSADLQNLASPFAR